MTLAGYIEENIELPGGVSASINEQSVLTISGPKGKLERDFFNPKTKVVIDGNIVTVNCKLPRVKDKAMVGTFAAHIRNMIEGVTEGFEYEMKIVYSHFPMKTSIKGDKFIIENFIGERSPRAAKIYPDVKVQVKGADVTVSGIDLQAVSQTAANIERATHIRGYDPRVFQDGIYITSKGKKVSHHE